MCLRRRLRPGRCREEQERAGSSRLRSREPLTRRQVKPTRTDLLTEPFTLLQLTDHYAISTELNLNYSNYSTLTPSAPFNFNLIYVLRFVFYAYLC